MVWSHLFFYHLLSAVGLYCLLSSDVWCHLFKVVMQHFPLFCPQFPSRGEVTQQQQQADHCSTTMGQYWGDQCTAIWWNQTPRIRNSSSSEGWNYQLDKQDKNFPDLDQITEELFHTVPLEQCSSVVFHCLWGVIHVCAKYLELAEVEMSLWQAQPRVRWVSFGVIWSEDCLQRQDQHQSHLKIVRNMRESLWCCSCLQIQNPFVCKRCELKFKQSSVLK